MQVLSEVRRVLRPGSPIVVTEVQNATFFIDPYSPHTMAYWLAFNDHQLELGGDPFVGAKLGNLLLAVGYHDITTKVRNIHLDNRAPGEREEFLAYWTELLLSGAPGLQAGQPDRLLGYPTATWEQMDDIGSAKYPVAFGDFRRGYVLADRVGIRITRDNVTNIGFVKFYVRRREGGIVLDNHAIKFLKTI